MDFRLGHCKTDGLLAVGSVGEFSIANEFRANDAVAVYVHRSDQVS